MAAFETPPPTTQKASALHGAGSILSVQLDGIEHHNDSDFRHGTQDRRTHALKARFLLSLGAQAADAIERTAIFAQAQVHLALMEGAHA